MSSADSNKPEHFPLHLLVWRNGFGELERRLNGDRSNLDSVDPRGRTPLHLSVALGHLESTRVLLRYNADVNHENAQGWTVLQEAVSTGDPELVQLVLQYRDYQRATKRLEGIPELLGKLRKAQDFYVEMKWEFTSWVPLVSRICPSDVYKVWKCGANLRVDTTLLGFDHMTWQRGSRSFIFKGQDEGALVMEVDHDKQVMYLETLALDLQDPELLLSTMKPSEEHIAGRLTSPIVSTHIDTKNIQFERNMSGIWGWRSEKIEAVNGYEAKVYSASNVELVTKTRTEHLSEQDKSRNKGTKTPLQSFLGIAEQHIGTSSGGAEILQVASPTNPTAITPEEYFDPAFDLGVRDIGRPIELTVKTQRFKAKLWLCENHPLSLVEQVTPIIDLMAISNAHFAKLRDFITLRLPSGFPVKIEIPLFHVLNARITFGNLNGCDSPVESVCCSMAGGTPSPSGEAEDPTVPLVQATPEMAVAAACPAPGEGAGVRSCEVDPSVFEAPRGYTVVGSSKHEPMRDEDDDLLQFAIQQSLLEAGTEAEQVGRAVGSVETAGAWDGDTRVTVWEALSNSVPGGQHLTDEERELERALQESLLLHATAGGCGLAKEGGILGTANPSDEAPLAALLKDVDAGEGDDRGTVPPAQTPVAAQSPASLPVQVGYAEQLRLVLEMSAREQQDAERRQREEEDELERVLMLSLTEK
ncbi:ankyrin repeat domain-containing protein 13D-like [Lampetra fluviatilis]